jgi:alkylation response protein AidB-like acyl-CoA dehydrogenase
VPERLIEGLRTAGMFRLFVPAEFGGYKVSPIIFTRIIEEMSAKVLSLLSRPDGASLKELMEAMGWLAHSVRGFLSGIVGKRMRLKLVPAKSDNGGHPYFMKN